MDRGIGVKTINERTITYASKRFDISVYSVSPSPKVISVVSTMPKVTITRYHSARSQQTISQSLVYHPKCMEEREREIESNMEKKK